MQFLKSLFFTAFMMASALAFGGFMSLCFWAPYRAQFAIARSWARLQFWLLDKVCGLKFSVEGRERIPAGNHIVMSNHTSAWETIAQFLIFPPQVWVLKRELLDSLDRLGLKTPAAYFDQPGSGSPRRKPSDRAGQRTPGRGALDHHFSRRNA